MTIIVAAAMAQCGLLSVFGVIVVALVATLPRHHFCMLLGEALVPLADLFNHKVALLPRGVALEAEKSSEGDLRIAADRVRKRARELAAELELDLGMDTTLHNIPGRLDVGVGEDEGGAVALLALRDITNGREVFNSYGEHDNRTLLANYGFTIAHNPLDTVRLPAAAVHHAAELALGERGLRKRMRDLRNTSHWSAELELLRTGAFEFDSSGRPPLELMLLLHLLFVHEDWMECSRQLAASGRRRFASLPLKEQLAPVETGILTPTMLMGNDSPNPAAVLLTAVRACASHLTNVNSMPHDTGDEVSTGMRSPALATSAARMHALRLQLSMLKLWSTAEDTLKRAITEQKDVLSQGR